MQYDLTNLQKNTKRRLPTVAKSFLYESKRNFWSYTMKFQIRHTETGSTNGTDNKVKQGRDWACWLYQGQISVMPFIYQCLYKNWIIVYNAT